MMKKVLICTKHKALAECVSKWFENHDCKLYRLVGNVGNVKKLLEWERYLFSKRVLTGVIVKAKKI